MSKAVFTYIHKHNNASIDRHIHFVPINRILQSYHLQSNIVDTLQTIISIIRFPLMYVVNKAPKYSCDSSSYRAMLSLAQSSSTISLPPKHSSQPSHPIPFTLYKPHFHLYFSQHNHSSQPSHTFNNHLHHLSSTL